MPHSSIKVVIGALGFALVAHANAAQARVMYVCPQLDTAADKLSVRVTTGCLSSTSRYKDNTLALKVDQDSATISVTGTINHHPPGSLISSADCMGTKSITLEASDVEARRYTVIYEGHSLGLSDLIEDPQPNTCLTVQSTRSRFAFPSANRTSYAEWSDDPVTGWREWRGRDPIRLLAPLLSGHPETEEGQPTLSLNFGKRQWSGHSFQGAAAHAPFLGVSIERHGFLDDAVSGDRYFAALRYDEGSWRIEHLWGQSLCARGENAGQWSGEDCP